MTTEQIQRRTAILAIGSALAGSTVLVALFVVQSDPRPLWLWAVFAIAFVLLEFSSVEISDRLFVSSSIMVAFAGLVAFDRASSVLAVTLMAAVAVLHPEDLRLRRWRQPTYNFGQLVLSTAIGAAVFYPFLPSDGVSIEHIPAIVAGAGIAAVVYNWVNFGLVSIYIRVAYPGRTRPAWSQMVGNYLLHAVLGAYGGLLGVAYQFVGPVALPLMLVTFLVGHVGFASYSRVRQAHEGTVGGFVKAIEALDPYTKGHTDRVAEFSRMTGERLGLDGRSLELLRWAALIHDVGKLAAPADLMRKEGELDHDERARMQRRMQVVEELLASVDFLRPAVEVVAASKGRRSDVSIVSHVVAAADAFDAMTSARSYRVAVTQSEAFAQLRAESERYGVDVVEALIAAIEDSGVVHGSPDAERSEELERLVQERARRA